MLKRFFSTGTSGWTLDLGILVIRVAIGAFMLSHGYPKLIRLFSGEEIRFADPFGFGPAFSLALAVFAEFFCSIFIAIGLGTRLAAIPLIVTMSVAAFDAHGADPFSSKEIALLYLLFYILLLFTGSRRYSLDRLLFRE
ncbi:MAG: DoxX family protein [Bacteroidales bacterium]